VLDRRGGAAIGALEFVARTQKALERRRCPRGYKPNMHETAARGKGGDCQKRQELKTLARSEGELSKTCGRKREATEKKE